MTFVVRRLDLGDDLHLDRAHEVMRRATLEDGRSWTTMWSRERISVALRQPPANELLRLLGAYDGPPAPESLVGVCLVHRDLAARTPISSRRRTSSTSARRARWCAGATAVTAWARW